MDAYGDDDGDIVILMVTDNRKGDAEAIVIVLVGEVDSGTQHDACVGWWCCVWDNS